MKYLLHFTLVVVALTCMTGCMDSLTDPKSSTTQIGKASLLGVEGLIRFDGQDYTGRIVVVTSPRGVPSEHCFESWTDYKVVIINPSNGRGMVSEMSFTAGAAVDPGDRFKITSQSSCNGSHRLSLDPK